MEDEKRNRAIRYSRVADFCKSCKAYKPRTRNQCAIYTHLLIEKQPDMIANERCFLDKDDNCRGYVFNGKNE